MKCRLFFRSLVREMSNGGVDSQGVLQETQGGE